MGLTMNSPGSEKFCKHVVEGGDGTGLLDLLSRSRAKDVQRYGVQVKTIVIQEADWTGFRFIACCSPTGSRATSSMRLRSRSTGGIGGRRPMRSTARRCCGRRWPGLAASGGSVPWSARRARKTRIAGGDARAGTLLKERIQHTNRVGACLAAKASGRIRRRLGVIVSKRTGGAAKSCDGCELCPC